MTERDREQAIVVASRGDEALTSPGPDLFRDIYTQAKSRVAQRKTQRASFNEAFAAAIEKMNSHPDSMLEFLINYISRDVAFLAQKIVNNNRDEHSGINSFGLLADTVIGAISKIFILEIPTVTFDESSQRGELIPQYAFLEGVLGPAIQAAVSNINIDAQLSGNPAVVAWRQIESDTLGKRISFEELLASLYRIVCQMAGIPNLIGLRKLTNHYLLCQFDRASAYDAEFGGLLMSNDVNQVREALARLTNMLMKTLEKKVALESGIEIDPVPELQRLDFERLPLLKKQLVVHMARLATTQKVSEAIALFMGTDNRDPIKDLLSACRKSAPFITWCFDLFGISPLTLEGCLDKETNQGARGDIENFYTMLRFSVAMQIAGREFYENGASERQKEHGELMLGMARICMDRVKEWAVALEAKMKADNVFPLDELGRYSDAAVQLSASVLDPEEFTRRVARELEVQEEVDEAMAQS